jgi:putative DNA methylase
MTSTAVVKEETNPGLAPFSLKNAPSFIETQFPVGRLSAEAYKERKAGAGQTLTALDDRFVETYHLEPSTSANKGRY